MKNVIAVAGIAVLALAFAAPASASSKFWGKLNSKVGGWGKSKVMKKGYLGSLLTKGMTKKGHGAFAKAALPALRGINELHGKCGGRWPNFRMAFANVIATKKGAGTALAGVMAPVLAAFQGGCSLIGKGGQSAVVKALAEARKQLEGKAKPFYLRQLKIAMGWMKKPNLWAGRAKAAAQKK